MKVLLVLLLALSALYASAMTVSISQFLTKRGGSAAEHGAAAAAEAKTSSIETTPAALASAAADAVSEEEEGEWEGNPSFVQTASGMKMTADADTEGESEAASAAAAAAEAKAEAAADADSDTDADATTDASEEALFEASAVATWSPGARDDVSGGKGSFRFIPPKGKGCWVEQNRCPRHNGLPKSRPFADGWFHRSMGYGWYGPWKTEKACLTRAKQYHEWRNGGETSSSVAVWRPTGRSAAWPAGGCWIRQAICAKYPAFTGYFYDTFDNVRSAINQDRCFKRAKEYHTWCQNPKTVTTFAEYRPTNRVKSFPEDAGCWIYGMTCPKHTDHVGYFRDFYGEANMRTAVSEEQCLQRAQQFHTWCGAPLDEQFTAEFKGTGRVRSYPSDLSGAIAFTDVTAHGSASCKVDSRNTLRVKSKGAEGACQLPFEALKIPAKQSLSDQIISFDVEFTRNPGGSVGRHGGIFIGSNSGGRNGNSVVDWIDRSFDRGYRVYGQADQNKWSGLRPSSSEPFEHWTIIVRADGSQQFRSGDMEWNSKTAVHNLNKPYIGFWAYHGVTIKVRNFSIRKFYAGANQWVDLKTPGKVKGNAEVVAIPNGVEIRSKGGEGAVSVPMSAFGLPHKHSLANKRISFDIEFTKGGSIGRHGGVFMGPGPNGRWNGNAAVDWIEAGAARGYRVYWQQQNEKWDYWAPHAKAADQHWEVAIARDWRMQFNAGDTFWNSRLNAAWNGGYIGFWVYNGVTMRVRNVMITDIDRDSCSSSPCKNSGVCVPEGQSWSCSCAKGFKGTDCSIEINQCDDEAVLSCNGGKCITDPKGYKCDCTGTGGAGARCDGYPLSGWFRMDDKGIVQVDGVRVAKSHRSADVVEIKAAAKPGSWVTFKGLNTAGAGMVIAWLQFRGESFVSDASWQCSADKGATWTRANVVATQGHSKDWGTTANIPESAGYIFQHNIFARDGWCRIRLPEHKFKTNDRVRVAVKNSIGAFCSRASGSTTYYYGKVCGNGGVYWTHYYTRFTHVRSEMRGQMHHCSKKRSSTDASFNAQFFGDCNTVPTIMSEHLFTSRASAIHELKIERNPCKAAPCSADATCEWAAEGPFPMQCRCKTGFTGEGYPWSPCQEHNECAGNNPCHHNARCYMTGPGDYACRCRRGFSGDGKRCTAIDVCDTPQNPCATDATCKSSGPGLAICECKTGYKDVRGDGSVCEPINACVSNPCGATATCEKAGPGTFRCNCAKGFAPDGNDCREIDECHPSPCHPNAACTKTRPGQYKCSCKNGFKDSPAGDGKLCLEIRPCDEDKGLCTATGERCKHTAPGKHQCVCKPGYKRGVDGRCKEVNPCDDNPCDGNAMCRHTGPGEFSCTCKAGWVGSGVSCRVSDVCSTHPCSPYARCEATGNKYTCTCNDGYKGDGQKCTPINACDQSNACDGNAVCRMTGPGTKTCTCKAGYGGPGEYCYPINACKSAPCKNGVCDPTGPGKYKCTCRTGFTNKGSVNPDWCVEINDCNQAKSPCAVDAVCKPTGPSKHECRCRWGYRGNGVDSCTPIDRCAEDKPCSSNAVCQVTGPGTFLCTCNKNYDGDGVTCSEINNCNHAPYPCNKNANCRKTGPGTHICTCKKGFDGDGVVTCKPHDNCVSNPCPANTACEVTGPGSHRCRPNFGYAFTPDQKDTVEIDNCKAAKSPCSPLAECAKTGPGTHQCTCKVGYHGDGVACLPVDACKIGPCDVHADCKVSGPGAHTCKCRTGYFGDGEKGHCTEINLCSTKNPCDGNADCTKTGPGRASCACKEGYAGNGMKCKPIDNCKAHPSPCAVNADCTTTGPGKHKCECKPGYKGDGLLCRFDSAELDAHDKRMRDTSGRIDELVPKVNRVIFDGHDRIQDAAIDEIHDSLNVVTRHVDKLSAIAQGTTNDLTKAAKAIRTVRENTEPIQWLATGPVPNTGGLPATDADAGLHVVGNLAAERSRDRGIPRMPAPPNPPPTSAAGKAVGTPAAPPAATVPVPAL